MCGRYNFSAKESKDIQEIVEEVQHLYPDEQIKFGDIYPTNSAPVIIEQNSRLIPVIQKWGYLHYKGTGTIINARAETITEKPFFRDSFFKRRCVVPASGFYEWDSDKRKFMFQDALNSCLYLAAVYTSFYGIQHFAIITTAANSSVAPVHNRMPVIVPKNQIPAWITNEDIAKSLLRQSQPELGVREV